MKKKRYWGKNKSLSLVVIPFLILIFISSIYTKQILSNSLSFIKLPPGFSIEVYTENLNSVRAMSFDTTGNLYAGSKNGNVYIIFPDRRSKVLDHGLDMPVGVDYHDGDLYVSEIGQIRVYPNIRRQIKEGSARYRTITKSIPKKRWHGWKFIKVGPDNKLYIPVGAPCNVCLRKDPRFAAILRMDLDGNGLEIYAHGVRNTVGFDWHPLTQELWFTDNGRDHLGDNLPPDELNRANAKGRHFGFPFVHGKMIRDPHYFSKRTHIPITQPQWELPAHVAALGMRFYTGDAFPEKYRNGIFIAEHGSWNRSSKIGYRISFVSVKNNRAVSYETFAGGWTKNEKVYGRPADVEIGPKGALFVSDDYAHKIYRISFRGN